MIVLLLASLAVSGWIGWGMAQSILAEAPGVPRWLEAIAPLKGRWLALFLCIPLILFAMSVTFVTVAMPLFFFTGLLMVLDVYHSVVAILAFPILGILAAWFIPRCIKPVIRPAKGS